MRQHTSSLGARVDAWFSRYPALGCLGIVLAIVLFFAVVEPWIEHALDQWQVGAGLFVVAIGGALLYDQHAREQRRVAASKRAVELRQEHPELAAVIDILETYRAVADEGASTSSMLEGVFFFVAGVATPILLTKLRLLP